MDFDRRELWRKLRIAYEGLQDVALASLARRGARPGEVAAVRDEDT